MTEFDRRIGALRAEEATLPPGPGPRRAEIGVLKGMLIADGCLRLRPEDEPTVPASRELIDEAITGLSGGTGHDPALLVRLGALLYARFRAMDGPEQDGEDAITALRRAAVAPAVAPADLPICCLLLGHLLITRHLPALRATGQADLNRAMRAMAGFQLDRARAVPDITRGIAFLDDEAASDLWPAPVRAWARMNAQAGRLLLEEDLSRQLDLVVDFLSATEGLAYLGGAEDWMRAPTAWVVLHKAQESGSLEEIREAAGQADEIFGALPPSDFMRAPLAHALGLASFSIFHDLEEALRYLTEGGESLPADHPYFGLVRSMLAGVTVTAEAVDPWRSKQPGEAGFPAVDRAVERAEEIADDARRKAAETGSADDASDAAREELLLGMTLFLRWVRDGGDEAHREAVSVLQAALPRLLDNDRMMGVAMGMLGAVLSGTHMAHGSLQHAQAARTFFTTARDLVRTGPEVNADLAAMCGGMALMRATEAWERQEIEQFTEARDELAWAVGALPADHPSRQFLASVLAFLRMQEALRADDTDEVRSALAEVAGLGDAEAPGSGHLWLQDTTSVTTAAAGLMHGLLDDDEARIAASVEALEHAAASETFAPAMRLPLLALLARGRLARPGGLDAGIAYAREALALLTPDSGEAAAPDLLFTLAEALHRRRGPDDDAVGTGLLALRAQLRSVLLQIGPEDGMVRARAAGRLAAQVAAWAVEGGEPARAVEALELGRGMVLHAATTFTSIPELLRETGRDDLAEQWCARRPERLLPADPMNLLLTAVTGGEMAADLHRRAVAALAERSAAGRLFTSPMPSELGAALERAGADALVYLCRGTEHGWALIIGRNGEPLAEPLPGLATTDAGPLRRYVDARERQAVDRAGWAAALGDLCDWAWPGIMANVLARCAPLAADGRPRIVLVPTGELGLVCWHAARRPVGGRPRYACEDAVISYAASGRQLADPITAARTARPLAVLVADPGDGDAVRLAFAVTETEALRDAFYQDGRMLGDEAEPGFERGTVAAVRAAFRSARMVHLATHAVAHAAPVDSALMLAREGGADGRLRLADLLDDPGSCRACELLVLSACVTDLTSAVYDEALTLSTAFRSAGVAEVIGSRWLVDDATTPVMMYVFHRELNRGADPAEALRRSQCWMADPGRDLAGLPGDLYHLATGPDRPLEDPACWAAFTHQGVPAGQPGHRG